MENYSLLPAPRRLPMPVIIGQKYRMLLVESASWCRIRNTGGSGDTIDYGLRLPSSKKNAQRLLKIVRVKVVLPTIFCFRYSGRTTKRCRKGSKAQQVIRPTGPS